MRTNDFKCTVHEGPGACLPAAQVVTAWRHSDGQWAGQAGGAWASLDVQAVRRDAERLQQLRPAGRLLVKDVGHRLHQHAAAADLQDRKHRDNFDGVTGWGGRLGPAQSGTRSWPKAPPHRTPAAVASPQVTNRLLRALARREPALWGPAGSGVRRPHRRQALTRRISLTAG